jgi:hypothetical protein
MGIMAVCFVSSTAMTEPTDACNVRLRDHMNAVMSSDGAHVRGAGGGGGSAERGGGLHIGTCPRKAARLQRTPRSPPPARVPGLKRAPFCARSSRRNTAPTCAWPSSRRPTTRRVRARAGLPRSTLTAVSARRTSRATRRAARSGALRRCQRCSAPRWCRFN